VKDAKKRFVRKDSIIDKTKKMCSYIADEMQGLCSYVSNGACGDGSTAFPQKARRTYQRKS
jgi:hypothetical protein